MSSPYSQLARLYDGLMDEVDYVLWSRYLTGLIRQHSAPGRRLLDIGCGTGTLTLLLAKAGFVVNGVDLSSDMLTVAADKGLSAGLSPTRWKCQDMRQLNFPFNSFDVAVCACDGFNYLLNRVELEQTLAGIHRCLTPQGLLLFDVHSDHKMRQAFANGQFIQESADGYCIWSSEYDEVQRDCRHELTVFLHQRDDLYRKTTEQHRQHYFAPAELAGSLANCGFDLLAVSTWGTTAPPAKSDERIQIVARRSDG